MLSCVVSAEAQEITAIDFNGAVIGKVIPDGKVVGFENQLIGNITADSLIVDFKGKLIGGVVPQGIAIGNDARLLGKVGNDGAIRLPSGQVVGRALPNGLVVNELFDVIGGIVFPGIVYGDKGSIVGRVSGDGAFVNLNGQKLGLITPDGYAYRKVDDEYVLSGRLISSKMVVSLQGDFIGSVVPGGEVSNFDSEVIGHIKANGYAFDAKNGIIGHIVNTGYAFDNNGKYIGIITYNGEVVNADNIIGKIRADGSIVDDSNSSNIGYGISFGATATDLRGRYLGRLLPEGYIARAQEKSYSVGAGGVVFDDKGRLIGKISKTGPVFDYKGELRGHALSNGTIISLGGTPIGQMVGNKAFDLSGREIGAVATDGIVFDAKNKVLGVPGINGQITDNDTSLSVSSQGFVFNQEGMLVGENVALGGIYTPNGTYVASIGLDGKALSSSGNKIGDIVGGGYVLDTQKHLLGKNIVSEFFAFFNNKLFGVKSEENLLLDTSKQIFAKIIPDNSLVATEELNSVNYSPRIGMSYDDGVILDFSGNLLGYVDILGDVSKLNGTKIGKIYDRNLVVDNNGLVIGNITAYGASVNNNCDFVGVLTPRGDIRNHRGTYLGRTLGNGYVISDSGANIAHMVTRGPVIDFSGRIIGFANLDGYAYNVDNGQLGCMNRKGYLLDGNGKILGRKVSYSTVMDFNDKIIGRSVLDGQIINKDNQTIGYQQPNGNVNSSSGLPLGAVFDYRFAFGLDNKLLGLVNEEGIVFDDKQEDIGSVNFEGYVIKNKDKIGYALFDMYVYDFDDNVVGYINRNGSVVDFNNQYLGQIDRGFVVDKKGEVVARGSRDYNIRDKSRLILGSLRLDGKVINFNNEVVGTLDKVGNVSNSKGEKIAQAYPLQYYSNISSSDRKMMFDKDGNFIGYLDENGNIVDENGNLIQPLSKDKENLIEQKHNVFDKDGNLIGVTDDDGNVLDANNKVIGKINESGEAVDGNGNIIGGIGKNWYEKAPLPTEVVDKEEDISPALKLLEKGTYKKSLGIALTPDGEYLGDIMEDHRVVNKEGITVGRLMPDGLVIDDDGNLIGIKETDRPSSSGMFVPPGTFGDGGAYGTGAGTPSNLGPGGGYGPGERYDPARQAALDAAMAERRKNISVGKISSGIRKEAFDGMQKDWSEQGINKVISSWRVDMSEMIFSDKPIPAVIARAIDSNNPAPITAFVERNVYAEEGRNVIIPAGSRLIGSLGGVSASAESTSESARVQISWERLIRPDGSIFVFQALTADAQGRGGALGYVDQQLFKKYTLPIMTSSLTSATSYFMAPSDDNDGENESPRQQAANDARENFINEMNQVFDEILADKSNIKPLTYIPAGTRIIVFPNSDLWLRSVERDSEESAKFQADKPTILLDDTKGGSLKDGPTPQPGTSVSSGGDVVYDAGADVEEAQNVALIDDTSSKKNKKSAPYIAPPPPPPSSTSTVAPATPSTNSGSKKNSDNAIPALF